MVADAVAKMGDHVQAGFRIADREHICCFLAYRIQQGIPASHIDGSHPAEMACELSFAQEIIDCKLREGG